MTDFANLQRYICDMQTAMYRITGECQKLREENERLRGRFNNKKKLSPEEVRRIKALAIATDMTRQEIADSFAVNKSTIVRILQGQYHANVR